MVFKKCQRYSLGNYWKTYQRNNGRNFLKECSKKLAMAFPELFPGEWSKKYWNKCRRTFQWKALLYSTKILVWGYFEEIVDEILKENQSQEISYRSFFTDFLFIIIHGLLQIWFQQFFKKVKTSSSFFLSEDFFGTSSPDFFKYSSNASFRNFTGIFFRNP